MNIWNKKNYTNSLKKRKLALDTDENTSYRLPWFAWKERCLTLKSVTNICIWPMRRPLFCCAGLTLWCAAWKRRRPLRLFIFYWWIEFGSSTFSPRWAFSESSRFSFSGIGSRASLWMGRLKMPFVLLTSTERTKLSLPGYTCTTFP